ncbi:hypothetical protein ACQQ2N_04675 [Dokdonella sp. MW10]
MSSTKSKHFRIPHPASRMPHAAAGCHEDSGAGTSVGFVPIELQHFSID